MNHKLYPNTVPSVEGYLVDVPCRLVQGGLANMALGATATASRGLFMRKARSDCRHAHVLVVFEPNVTRDMEWFG